ncbi:MAG: zinc ribbon domain-containing protein [Clostridia bacterium]|nr:zinc ribbon domain-containing protein [Clostridia bacterium]
METKFCENCGAKMPIESKFCTECGTPFPKAEPKKEEPAPAVEAEPEKPAEPAEPAEAAETPYEAPIELPARDPEPVIPAAPIPPVTPNPAPAQPQPQTQPVQQPYGQPAQPAQPVRPAPQPAQPAQPVRPAPQPQQTAYAQPVKPAPTAYGTPVYGAAAVDPEITKESVKGTKYEPVSALGWFGIFLLVGIPLVGPLLVIIWACCGCRKQNKRTFARGILISWLVGLIIAGLLGLALRSKIIDFAKDYAAENGIAYSEGTVIEDVLNSFLNRYGYEIAK